MRILIASDTYYPHVNGNSYFTQRLAHYLVKKGHTVLVMAPATRFDFDQQKINSVEVFGVPSVPVFINNFRTATPFLIKKGVEEKILSFKPDVIHVQSHITLCSAIIDVAQKYDIPCVGTNHFMPENLVHYLHLSPILERKVVQYAWLPFRKVFEKLDIVTTPTQSAADLLKHNKFPKKVIPISCGIDLNMFYPRKKNEKILEKYGLNQRPILFSVGRLDKEKNIDFILSAMAKVPKDTNVQLVVGGSGAEEKYLHELAHLLGIEDRVTFVGFVPDYDLPLLYAASSCFVMAGSAELQSIVTMESMASGLPVLALKAVALPELVKHGENGYLFRLKSPSELAQCIEKVFTNDMLREKMGKKSLELIAKHDINKVITQFEEVYKEAIEMKKK